MDEALFKRQAELELEMQAAGAARFWEAVNQAVRDGEESITTYGLTLARKTVLPLASAVSSYLAGPVDTSSVFKRLLEDADPKVTAFISVKIVLDNLSRGLSFTRLSVAIGTSLEDEARFRQFSGQRKAYWETIVRRLDESATGKGHKRKVLIHAMNKLAETDPEVAWSAWTETERFHVGARMLDLLLATTKMISVNTIPDTAKGGKQEKKIVSATPELLEWINGHKEASSLLYPMFLPMLCPPKPWTHPYSGGYHTKAVRQVTLVKTFQTNYLEELFHRRDEMPVVYEAVNRIQDTPWKINPAIYYLVQQIWDEGLPIDVLEVQQDIPLPPKPHDIDTNDAARKAWKGEAAKIYTENSERKSKRLQVLQMLSIAKRFVDEEVIYFPHSLDFRGRAYPIPSELNPQGCDLAKGLLCFAEGKPIGDDGFKWLLIHAANCFGEDKCSLDERVKWGKDNLERMIGCSKEPLGEKWWLDADKPWQFLAACMEIHAALSDPTYKSCLPVSVDGSCNGLQNFSAMLRDAIGGRAVNLVPQEQPNDIYEQVADVTRRKVEADVARGIPEAAKWLAYGFDRNTTKRPVMTLPYGARLYSTRKYVAHYILKSGKPRQWDAKEDFTLACYLAAHIWNSIGEVVVAARRAMDWLQEAARVAASEGIPINWTTPVGFPVQQAYRNTKLRRVITKLGEQIIFGNLSEETDKLDNRRQSQGISPNFVHSMDASAMMLCVKKCAGKGLRHFGMVHDSYGTLAADMDIMAVCLREAFVELYQTDVLEEFRKSILAGLPERRHEDVPPCPPKGELNLNAVKQSVYFFA